LTGFNARSTSPEIRPCGAPRRLAHGDEDRPASGFVSHSDSGVCVLYRRQWVPKNLGDLFGDAGLVPVPGVPFDTLRDLVRIEAGASFDVMGSAAAASSAA
jgi:hypothetical protein